MKHIRIFLSLVLLLVASFLLLRQQSLFSVRAERSSALAARGDASRCLHPVLLAASAAEGLRIRREWPDAEFN